MTTVKVIMANNLLYFSYKFKMKFFSQNALIKYHEKTETLISILGLKLQTFEVLKTQKLFMVLNIKTFNYVKIIFVNI